MSTEIEAEKLLASRLGEIPKVAMMLGSGWNRVIEEVGDKQEVGYQEWLGVTPSVSGHEGKLVVGKLAGKKVVLLSGRLHTYEGYSPVDATMPIRVLNKLGMKKLVITSASGGLNEKYKVGDFVLVTDVLSLFLGTLNPLTGSKFLDMSRIVEEKTLKGVLAALKKEKIRFHEGTYAFVRGPHYETPTDKRALRMLGADVVGMSTVPEILAAKALEVEVLPISFVTNLAFVKHDHNEVVATAEKASKQMVRVLIEIIRVLS